MDQEKREKNRDTILMSGTYKNNHYYSKITKYWRLRVCLSIVSLYVLAEFCGDATFFYDLKAEYCQHAYRRNSPEQPYRTCL